MTTKPPPPISQNKNRATAPATSRPDEPEFEIRETKLCAELNVSKDELRRRRQYFLAQGQHWDYVDKRVLLTRVGAEILRGTRHALVPDLSGKNAPTADSGSRRAVKALLVEKNPPPPVFSGTLVAWAMPSRNERLLVAHLPGLDPSNPLNLVSCFVRSNRNFLRGMQLPGPGRQVKQVSETTYELVGECPRWRGRW